MADVLHGAIKLKDVSFVFDYSENSNNRKTVYHPAPNFPLDWSSEENLDYILLRVNDIPGKDLVERTARGWLQPLKHSFSEGEPLFIVQHPNGGPLRFAFDRVKWCEETRITYWTNTEQGSSGAPCFTFT